jgi:hypothetical protein
MITDPSAYASYKRRFMADQVLDLDERYGILEALYQEARLLGGFTERDLMLGLEDDVRLATALSANVSNPPREDREVPRCQRPPLHGHRRTGFC